MLMNGENQNMSRIARWSVSYYDIVLLALPIVLVGGFVLSAVSPVPVDTGLVLTGVASALLVADALFKRPPSARSA